MSKVREISEGTYEVSFGVRPREKIVIVLPSYILKAGLGDGQLRQIAKAAAVEEAKKRQG